MECGRSLSQAAPAQEPEPAANLCPNPVCGTMNPPNDRQCIRCGTPLPAAIGQMIQGRYRVDRQLAVGGFGIVYQGTDTQSGDRIAIKEMIDGDAQEAKIRRNFFRREAEILRGLQALPSVPRLYEFIETKSAAYLVMEFLPGKNLLQLLEEPGAKPFPLARVIPWATTICQVLSHLHSQNPPIVHRDLKPDNIMLLPDGVSIRLIDFGTARELGKAGAERSVTKTKVFTEGYAPPEQVIGKPEPRSDLFALAGTLYHLVTGKAPEGFFTSVELRGRLKEPNSSIAAAETWFYELLAINLSEDLNDRYWNAADVARDLETKTVTREVYCLQCGTASPMREPYCIQCATPLTPAGNPCGKCHEVNLMGCRFCVFCGSRVG